LLKLKKELAITIGEINRLARYVEKGEDDCINYDRFLNHLDKEFVKVALQSNNTYNYETKFTLAKFAKQLVKYLEKHNLSIRMLIRRILGLSEDQSEEEMHYQ